MILALGKRFSAEAFNGRRFQYRIYLRKGSGGQVSKIRDEGPAIERIGALAGCENATGPMCNIDRTSRRESPSYE